jgi:chaperonin GroEL
MNSKQFRFEEDARIALRDGIDQVAEVVAMTLGPRGRNVGLSEVYGSPTITSDGHSIAQQVELKDPFLEMGASMAREVALKIKEKSGDGTTTGIVLLRAMVQGGVKNISSGSNPPSIKKGMDKALELILKEIDQMAKQVKGDADTKNIASSTASGNGEVGAVIAECFAKVGKDGVVTIEEGKGIDTQIELVEGMQFDRGYVSSYFCTNGEKMLAEMHQPFVLITDKKVSSAQEILPILQHIATTGQELVIIAEDLDGDALSTLVMNKLRGTLKVVAVKAPGFGDQRKAMLEDLAVLTGAEFVTEEKGYVLKDVGPEVLGRAEQIVVGKEKTTIVDGKGTAIKERITQIEAEMKIATSNYDREKLSNRKAKLQGGVAVVKVGAPTESEMKKKKQLYEDSLNSTRAALEEGIVPGGGIALLHAARAIVIDLDREEQIGANLLIRACEAPFRQIAFNTGYDGSLLLEEVLKSGKTIGFNAVTEKVEDLLKAGVIDPAKVVKNSLIHAVSMAGVVLLSEALMANED